MKDMMRFGRLGKLSPRYIGPFEILECIWGVVYRLALPPMYSAILSVFHVLMLRWYIPDESHVLQYDSIQMDKSLAFVEEPVLILAKDMRKLRSREISVVKVQWNHSLIEKATWEVESKMRAQYS